MKIAGLSEKAMHDESVCCAMRDPDHPSDSGSELSSVCVGQEEFGATGVLHSLTR